VLRVRVDLVPAGDPKRASPIAEIHIGNASGVRPVSDYQVELFEHGELVRRTVVRRHRRANGWAVLVARAVKSLIIDV
jgi:hypothetical protein